MEAEKIDMTHIFENETHYRVRLTLFDKSYIKTFVFAEWGTKEAALEAALNYRSSVRAYISTIEEPYASNLGVPCVHRQIQWVKGVATITYVVYYHADGKFEQRRRNRPHASKMFAACPVEEYNPSMDLRAFLSAKRFRRVYETCRDKDIPFNHRAYLRRWHVLSLEQLIKPEVINCAPTS